MNSVDARPFRRRTAALAAAAAISLWPVFTSIPVSGAEPYGDDDGGSSYSDDGGSYGGGEEGTAPEDAGSYGGGEEGGTPEDGGSYGGGEEGTAPEDAGSYGGGEEGGTPEGGGSYGGGEEGTAPEDAGQEPTGDTGYGGGTEGTDHGGGTEGTEHGGGNEGTEQGGQPSGDTGYGGGNEGSGHGGQPTGETGYGVGDHLGESGIMQPTELEAPQSDVTAVARSRAVEVSSSAASSEEITNYLESIESTSTLFTVSNAMTLSSPVSQWNSRWIRYDRNYRPVFVNPYANPMQVLYQYGGKTQSFTVAPRQKAALNVPDPGVYSFTAFTRPPSGPVSNVSVGSFSGGGYLPQPGQTPPQKPSALQTVTKPIVQVKFAQGTSDPFRVNSVVDLGKDAAVNGATKVLIDGEIPAWGEWSKSSAGEAQFNITQTQLLPGLKPPGQDPLPGYKVKLAAASHSTSWYESSRAHVIGASVAAGVLALAAVALFLIRRRRTEE